MDPKELKERLAKDGKKAIEKGVTAMKKRGRKPRNTEEGLKNLSKVKVMNCADKANAIKIIEEEIGKEQLFRLAVKYLYNAIVEVKNA